VIAALEDAAVGGEPIEVETTMSLLVGQRGEQSAPKRGRKLRPAKQGPGEVLDRHQLVMSEARQAADPLTRVDQLAGTRQPVAAAAHPQAGIAYRPLDQDRRP